MFVVVCAVSPASVWASYFGVGVGFTLFVFSLYQFINKTTLEKKQRLTMNIITPHLRQYDQCSSSTII